MNIEEGETYDLDEIEQQEKNDCLTSYAFENIKSIHEINDKDKGEFIEKTIDEIEDQFSGLINLLNEEDEIDNLDHNLVNYKPYSAQYYEEKYPGFPDSVYHILENSTEPENKVIDTRQPSMVKKYGEFNPYSNPTLDKIKQEMDKKIIETQEENPVLDKE